jgi:hypothetical protein
VDADNGRVVIFGKIANVHRIMLLSYWPIGRDPVGS